MMNNFNDIFIGSDQEYEQFLDGEGFEDTDIFNLVMNNIFKHYDNCFVTDSNNIYVHSGEYFDIIWVPMCWDEFEYSESMIFEYIKDSILADSGIEFEYGIVIDTYFNKDKQEYLESIA